MQATERRLFKALMLMPVVTLLASSFRESTDLGLSRLCSRPKACSLWRNSGETVDQSSMWTVNGPSAVDAEAVRDVLVVVLGASSAELLTVVSALGWVLGKDRVLGVGCASKQDGLRRSMVQHSSFFAHSLTFWVERFGSLRTSLACSAAFKRQPSIVSLTRWVRHMVSKPKS